MRAYVRAQMFLTFCVCVCCVCVFLHAVCMCWCMCVLEGDHLISSLQQGPPKFLQPIVNNSSGYDQPTPDSVYIINSRSCCCSVSTPAHNIVQFLMQ